MSAKYRSLVAGSDNERQNHVRFVKVEFATIRMSTSSIGINLP